MGDGVRGLPEFPREESEKYERDRAPAPEPDRLIDQLRHAWPRYLALGGMLGLWAGALVVVRYSSRGWETFWAVLVVPALLILFIARFIRIFSVLEPPDPRDDDR